MLSNPSSRWTIPLALALLMVLSGPSLAGKGKKLVLDVEADLSTLNVVDTSTSNPPFPGEGPFYVGGTIFRHGTNTAIGDFHCWGFFIQGGAIAVVSQEYDLWGRGKIQVQGVEDNGPRGVTAGTGKFVNVRGEMTGANLDNFPSFTVTFRLNKRNSDSDSDSDSD